MGSHAGLSAVPQPPGWLCDFGKPLFPVGKATPRRTATKAPVGTRRHQTFPTCWNGTIRTTAVRWPRRPAPASWMHPEKTPTHGRFALAPRWDRRYSSRVDELRSGTTPSLVVCALLPMIWRFQRTSRWGRHRPLHPASSALAEYHGGSWVLRGKPPGRAGPSRVDASVRVFSSPLYPG